MSNDRDGQPFDSIFESFLPPVSKEPGWFHYDALNKVDPLGRQMKPWDELGEEQRSLIVLHVNDMSQWRAEGKVDTADADLRFESDPELRKLLE